MKTMQDANQNQIKWLKKLKILNEMNNLRLEDNTRQLWLSPSVATYSMRVILLSSP